MTITIPHCEIKSLRKWSNYHGTIADQAVPVYCTPDVLGTAGDAAPRRLARHGSALKAILAHCFSQNPPARIRTIGARWSLSNIIKPNEVVLDLANMNTILRVKGDWLTPEYRASRGANGYVPVFAQGGTHVSTINRMLGQAGLALQTSGASDGHRIAGCIATGTHGSHFGVGAVHDTVLAIHLVTGPNQALFLQPSSGAACGEEVAAWLARETGIPTTNVRDDEQFHAAQVSLGSLGIVHGVVLETVPIYRLRQRQLGLPWSDQRLWAAIRHLNLTALHPGIDETPYYFQAVMHPYPTAGKNGAYVTMYWKEEADGVPFTSPMPVAPQIASDVMGLIGKLSEIIDESLTTPLLRLVLSDQLEQRYPQDNGAHVAFPGQVFGPTSLPPGNGASTEIIVSQPDADDALNVIYEVLTAEAARGRHLLGALGIRFVPRTKALLGMNINPMNVYIELPSIRTPEIGGIFRKCWDGLEAKGISFTCHWGQELALSPARLNRYFGDRVARWQAARSKILPTETARRVFASPLLAEVGL